MTQFLIYLVSLTFQIIALIFFIRMARFLDMAKINGFTIAFLLVTIRRIIVISLKSFLPMHLQSGVTYVDVNFVPILFSLLLLVGAAQLYRKVTRLRIPKIGDGTVL